jgi:hypothetical protein
MKSNTCFKKDGQPLTVFFSEYEAQEGADYANSTYDNNLSPYQCKKCDGFHLSPANRQTPSTQCSRCKGADGAPKNLYETEQGAQRRAIILYTERNTNLYAYPCPYHKGWHLTKR